MPASDIGDERSGRDGVDQDVVLGQLERRLADQMCGGRPWPACRACRRSPRCFIAATDVVTMMRPPLAFFFMCGTLALIVEKIEVRLVSMTRSQRSSETFSNAPSGLRLPVMPRKPGGESMPTLANTTSSLP